MAKFKKAAAAPTHRPPVSEPEKIWMFAVALREPAVFEQMAEKVKDEHFTETELWLALIWRIVRGFFGKHHKLPGKKMIVTKINAELKVSPEAIAEGDEVRIGKFLTTVANLAEADMYPEEALATAQRFLEDRLIYKASEQLSRPQTPLQLSLIFSQMAESASSLTTLSTGDLPTPFPEGWDSGTQIGVRTPTNITFIDHLLGGGTAAGESYGILGPYGGGKTTLSVNITTNEAKKEYVRWVAGGCVGVPRRAYHFVYEDVLDDIRLLALSYMAEIPKNRLETLIKGRDITQFSTAGTYQEYEVDRFARQRAAGATPPGELERYQHAVEILNHCWRVVDMTGADEANPGRGNGLVEELAAIIQADIARSGAGVLTALADYAGAAVEAYLSHTGRERTELRPLLKAWPFAMKRKIGIKFGCPVWSIHQLNTDSNSAKPGHLPMHTDSADCKSFSENCNFCLVMGLPTREGLLAFASRKHRRTAELDPIVLRLRGDLAKVEDTRDEWVFDARTKTIVERETQRSFYGSLSGGTATNNNNGDNNLSRRNGGQIHSQRRAADQRILREQSMVH